MLAVDAFPYLVRPVPAIAARHVADVAGLLQPGGALAIFNYSYRGDLDADRADIARLAAAHGFAIERNGTRDLHSMGRRDVPVAPALTRRERVSAPRRRG